MTSLACLVAPFAIMVANFEVQASTGFGRIFYRHRRPNIKRKSGNIADFCRRWGKNYPYMIVFDADSIMAGNTLVRMVRMMALNPRVGILQTVPAAVGRQSFIARIQQFSGHVYGPIFSAGLHFWQLGDAQYWGQNIQWHSPPRQDNNTSWAEAFRFHGWGMVLALVWSGSLFIINRPFFWWLLSILGPLLFVPISVWSSRVNLGIRARKIGLFLIPEEICAPPELIILAAQTQVNNGGSSLFSYKEKHDGFVLAVVHPYVNGLHCAFRRDRRSVMQAITDTRRLLIEKVLTDGPERLSKREKLDLLSDPDYIAELYRLVWQLSGGAAAQKWGLSPI